MVDPLALYEPAYPTLVYRVAGELEVWSPKRGACLIFESAWHVSAFIGVVVPGLRGTICVAPSLYQR